MKSVALSPQKPAIDMPLLVTSFILVIFGLILIYDASIITALRDFGDKLYYFKNQLIWASLGAFTLLFFSFFDYHRLLKFGPKLFLFSLVLLILVLIPHIGSRIYGARRWITVANFNFQPSEIAKLALIFYQTAIIAKFQNYRVSLADATYVLFLPTIVTAGLILAEPDLGTALIIIGVSLATYFIGGGPLWHFLLFLPVLVSGSVLAIILEPYRANRLKAFLDPNFDPQGASYQIKQIIASLSSGGFLGVGIGGSQGKFDFIPEVHSDAIFAVVAEELGFIGAVFVLLLFLFLINRGIQIAKGAKDDQGRILALAITAMISIQIFLNLASIVALVPLTGVPLPFISYGGSSLVVTMSAIGILNNIKRQS